MSIPREGSRQTDKGILVSNNPDWCWVRCGTSRVLIPFDIYAKQEDDASTAPTVRQQGKRSHTSGSLITRCFGDEAGNGLGLESGTKESVCWPVTWSKSVRIEGKHAVRYNDLWAMNHGNTTGKLAYMEDTKAYKEPKQPDYGPPRDMGNGVVSDAPADSIEPEQQYAQARPAPSQPVRNVPTYNPPTYNPNVGASGIGSQPANDPNYIPQTPRGSNVGPIQSPLINTPNSSFFNDYRALVTGNHAPAYYTDLPPPLDYIEQANNGYYQLSDGSLVKYPEIEAMYAVHKAARETNATSNRPVAVPSPDNVRVSQDRKRKLKDCGIAPYKDNNCSLGKAAHHGIVDFPLRTGTQSETIQGLDHRVPGSPQYMEAWTICIDNSTHTNLHRSLNSAIGGLGSLNGGTLRYDQVQRISFQSIDAIPENELSKACKELYKILLKEQYTIKPSNILNYGASTIPVRGTMRRPNSDIMQLLSKEWGFTYP